MRQHGGSCESLLCHTKGLAFWSGAVGIYSDNKSIIFETRRKLILSTPSFKGRYYIVRNHYECFNVQVPVRDVLFSMHQLIWVKTAVILGTHAERHDLLLSLPLCVQQMWSYIQCIFPHTRSQKKKKKKQADEFHSRINMLSGNAEGMLFSRRNVLHV